MRLVECAQNSPEWLAARAGLATASNFSDILAQSRTKGEESTMRRNYRIRLVVERLTGKPMLGGFKSRATEQGHEREPYARKAYMVATGNLVQTVGVCLHDTLECAASPDGLIEDEGGLEVKCPELAAHLEYLQRKDEPPEYRAQIQGGMWVTGRKWWDFVSWNPDFPERLRLKIIRVQRNEIYIAGLATAVALFMSEVREEETALHNLAATT